MGIDGLGGFRVRRGSQGPATEALSREGIDRLVDDAINDLTVLKREITPDSIREYVEHNVRINVDVGRHLEPSAADLEEALDPSGLAVRCASCAAADTGTADAEHRGGFRR